MSLTLIQHYELTSAQSSIDFTTISSEYTHLCLKASLRQTDDSSFCGLKINGGVTGLSAKIIYGNGSVDGSLNYAVAGDYNVWAYVNPSSYTANTFSSTEFTIFNYASNVAKPISINSVAENNDPIAPAIISAGLYNSSTAITSLSLVPLNSGLQASGTFTQYSSATLYGITAGSDGVTTVS